MTRRTGMSALMSVGTTMALMGMALAQSASPSPSGSPGGSSSGYGGSSSGYGSSGSSSGYSGSGSSSGGSAYGAPGGAQTAGAIDSTTVTTSQTVDYGTEGYGAETAIDTAPLDNTGGEPLVITLLGSLVAGSALLMRRKLSAN